MLAEHGRRGWQISLPQRPHSLFTMSLMSSPNSRPCGTDRSSQHPGCGKRMFQIAGSTSTLGRLPSARRQVPKEWWSQTGSNRRPHACKARALPAELWPQRVKPAGRTSRVVVGLGRLERPTSPLSGVRSNHLSYRPSTIELSRDRTAG